MNIDNKIANIPCIINLFKNIHPNIITGRQYVSSMVLNLNQKQCNANGN